MLNTLVESIEDRFDQISAKSAIFFLKSWDISACLPTLVSVTYLYTRAPYGEREEAPLAELSTAIGRALMSQHKLRRHTGTAAKLGTFLLYSLEELGLTGLRLGSVENSKHNKYLIEVIESDKLAALWKEVPIEKIRSMPGLTPHPSWTSARDEEGRTMVKTGDISVLRRLSPARQPLLFSAINKVQKTSWRIDPYILRLQEWAFLERAEAFKDIWAIHSRDARASKIREFKITQEIAERFIGLSFYHRYYFDFRSRIYPATAYLHEQGSDVAKGLLRRAIGRPTGQDGLKWLLIAIATKWAGPVGDTKTDKLSMRKRHIWGLQNLGMLLSFAENPRRNTGWMSADSPWQFIAYCRELAGFMRHWAKHQNYGYVSAVVVYIDGSTNGLQHLSALTRDEQTAKHVNLLPTELPGDLYSYIGQKLWSRLKAYTDEMDEQEIADCEAYIDHLALLKRRAGTHEPGTHGRQAASQLLAGFKKENALLHTLAAPVFWRRITEPSHIRKIVKRELALVKFREFRGHLYETILGQARVGRHLKVQRLGHTG